MAFYQTKDGDLCRIDGVETHSLLDIGTFDVDDKPRIEIRRQQSPAKNDIPSMMIDLHNTFNNALFSFYSKDCLQMAPLTRFGAIDLEYTKRISVCMSPSLNISY